MSIYIFYVWHSIQQESFYDLFQCCLSDMASNINILAEMEGANCVQKMGNSNFSHIISNVRGPEHPITTVFMQNAFGCIMVNYP